MARDYQTLRARLREVEMNQALERGKLPDPCRSTFRTTPSRCGDTSRSFVSSVGATVDTGALTKSAGYAHTTHRTGVTEPRTPKSPSRHHTRPMVSHSSDT